MGVNIADGEDIEGILAVAVTIDLVYNNDPKERGHRTRKPMVALFTDGTYSSKTYTRPTLVSKFSKQKSESTDGTFSSKPTLFSKKSESKSSKETKTSKSTKSNKKTKTSKSTKKEKKK